MNFVDRKKTTKLSIPIVGVIIYEVISRMVTQKFMSVDVICLAKPKYSFGK